MALYYLLVDADAFHKRLRPALADSWRRRSFEPCRALCAELIPAARAFAERYHIGSDESLLLRVAAGLPFNRDFWRFLTGELLWLCAADIPEIETTPDALACLLGAPPLDEEDLDRARLAPIHQAYHGARDLTFGTAFYQPAHAGFNDADDVARLADFLAAIEPQRWTAADLARLPGLADDEDRAEELEFVREWFPAFQALYRRAREEGQIIVCESMRPAR